MENYSSTEKFLEIQKTQLETLFQRLNIITYPSYFELYMIIPREFLLTVLMVLKNDSLFNFKHLIDITVLDEPGKTLRFSIIYNFLSISYNQRFVVLTQTNEFIPLSSVVTLFTSANWAEREIWDLYGLNFLFHPDLRRILTDYGFEGFPFRKDFPLTGYKEIIYSETLKSLKYEKVELSQTFRTFKYQNPWIHVPSSTESEDE